VDQQKFTTGWDEGRVREILGHYEDQTEEATAEDEDILRIVESEQEVEL
jgi:hypothetical protein